MTATSQQLGDVAAPEK